MNRRSRDAYYTPQWLADEIIAALPGDLSGLIIDPAAGEGALLSAMERRFNERVRGIAIDIDANVVRKLSAQHPNWIVSRADFLSVQSRVASSAWRETRGGVSAVLLNPPFSYRGNGGPFATYRGFSGRVAPAMQFLLTALQEFEPTYGFVAILPDGALHADRHAGLWAEISIDYSVERIKTPSTSSFQGARVATTVVVLRKQVSSPVASLTSGLPVQDVTYPQGCACVEIIRGRIPVYRLPEFVHDGSPDVPFFHTTSFRREPLETGARVPYRLADCSPFVLISRVGRWQDPLIVDVGRLALSDCVIALRPRDRSKLAELREWFMSHASEVRGQYRGTGASYVTVSALENVLRKHGWHPHKVRASEDVGLCCCASLASPCTGAEKVVGVSMSTASSE